MWVRKVSTLIIALHSTALIAEESAGAILCAAIIGALIAVEEGASGNAERNGEQIEERNTDQPQAD